MFGLLLLFWIPAHAGSVEVDNSCTGTPPVGASFDFLVASPPLGSETSSQCFITTTIAFQTLDFFFAAPPAPGDLTSCTSTFFSICSITETGGITDVRFVQGTDTGVPTATDFNVKLQGFTPRQQINAVANVPEPDPAWTIGLSLVAAAVVTTWRSVRLQLTRDRTA